MSLDAQKLAALLAALGSFNVALRNRLDNKLDITAQAADSLKLGGKTLAEVQQIIGDDAAAQLATLNDEFEAFIARQDNPHNVTKAQVGLGNVDNFGTATNAEAVGGTAADKFVTPANLQAFWADKVGSAPETLDTIQELAAALQNNPDAIGALQSIAGDNQAAIAALQTALATAISDAAADATAKADAAQVAATAAAIADADAKLATKLGKTEQAADSALLEGSSKAQIIAEAQAGVDMSNVVQKSDDFGEYKIGEGVGAKSFNTLFGEKDAALQTLSDDLAAFIAAKASTADALAGTDDAKYITAVGLKAKVDAAISDLVDGAPAALDTLKELADALADQNDAVAALVTVLDTKLNLAQVNAQIASALADGGYLTAESDLGANPVAVPSIPMLPEEVVPTFTLGERTSTEQPDSVVRFDFLEGDIANLSINYAGDGVWVPAASVSADAATTLESMIRSLIDGNEEQYTIGATYYYPATPGSETRPARHRTLSEHLAALNAGVQSNAGQIAGVQQSVDTSIQNVQQSVDNLFGSLNTNIQNVQQYASDNRQRIFDLEQSSLSKTGNADTVTVTDSGEQVELATLIAQIKAAISAVDSGASADIAALQTALNAFIAAKASAAEVVAGTDDAKYVTALGVKAATDAAISALVDGAPTALDTLKELADALTDQGDAVAALVLGLDGKLGKTEQAADSAKLGGKSLVELTADGADVAAGTAVDKFVTPAALATKTAAQDLAIAANTAAIDDLVLQLTNAFNDAASELDPVSP